jgi:hypothetical protein
MAAICFHCRLAATTTVCPKQNGYYSLTIFRRKLNLFDIIFCLLCSTAFEVTEYEEELPNYVSFTFYSYHSNEIEFSSKYSQIMIEISFGTPCSIVRLRRRRQSVGNLPPPIQRYSYVATVYSSRIAAFSIRVGLFTST